MSEDPEKAREKEESIDVMDMLRGNVEAAKKHEEPIEIIKKRSRRKRDYWIILMLANIVFGGLALTIGSSIIALVYILSGALLFSAAFTWIMWVVISDY